MVHKNLQSIYSPALNRKYVLTFYRNLLFIVKVVLDSLQSAESTCPFWLAQLGTHGTQSNAPDKQWDP